MKQELQDKLFAKYPEIFRDRTLPMTESCMHWGIETGDGWFDLIDYLCEALTYTYSTSLFVGEEYVEVKAPQAVANQVKEKFSTLRFYYHLEFDPAFSKLCETNEEARKIAERYSTYFDGIVHMAEIMSGRICEMTGKPGECHVSGKSRYGWQKTLNREFAKTDEFHVGRGFIPFTEIKEEENEI